MVLVVVLLFYAYDLNLFGVGGLLGFGWSQAKSDCFRFFGFEFAGSGMVVAISVGLGCELF